MTNIHTNTARASSAVSACTRIRPFGCPALGVARLVTCQGVDGAGHPGWGCRLCRGG